MPCVSKYMHLIISVCTASSDALTGLCWLNKLPASLRRKLPTTQLPPLKTQHFLSVLLRWGQGKYCQQGHLTSTGSGEQLPLVLLKCWRASPQVHLSLPLLHSSPLHITSPPGLDPAAPAQGLVKCGICQGRSSGDVAD